MLENVLDVVLIYTQVGNESIPHIDHPQATLKVGILARL